MKSVPCSPWKNRWTALHSMSCQSMSGSVPGAVVASALANGFTPAKLCHVLVLNQSTAFPVDPEHASGYLSAVAEAALPKSADKTARQRWLHEQCHRLKHELDAAKALLGEMQCLPTTGLNTTQRERLESAITYFNNHHHKMDYANALQNHWPIGSGVTEAACKTLVKQRLCRSGMRWKEKGAAVVLSLRALMLTPDR
jgi:hypothetical protein